MSELLTEIDLEDYEPFVVYNLYEMTTSWNPNPWESKPPTRSGFIQRYKSIKDCVYTPEILLNNKYYTMSN